MKWFYVLLLCGAALAENPDENIGVDDPNLFEGDIILTPEQRMVIEDPLARGSVTYNKWPGGVVPYVIDRSLTPHYQATNAIRQAIGEWARYTCIRFKPRTNEGSYVIFTSGNGCSSHVGRKGGYQTINLASGCWTKGIVAHEIGHALGFFHEQSRPDRDQFVRIVWDNIIPNTKYNFYLNYNINSLGTPYDYGSLMHYGATAFTKNGGPTILTPSGKRIGQRQGISRMDAHQMNLLYRCRRRMAEEAAVDAPGGETSAKQTV